MNKYPCRIPLLHSTLQSTIQNRMLCLLRIELRMPYQSNIASCTLDSTRLFRWQARSDRTAQRQGCLHSQTAVPPGKGHCIATAAYASPLVVRVENDVELPWGWRIQEVSRCAPNSHNSNFGESKMVRRLGVFR